MTDKQKVMNQRLAYLHGKRENIIEYVDNSSKPKLTDLQSIEQEIILLKNHGAKADVRSKQSIYLKDIYNREG